MATTDTTAIAAAQAVGTNEAVILWHENDLVESNIAKLYLKERWSDVSFIFDADQGDGRTSERIYAHKAILAAGSDVFDAMFFGPLRENSEVKIVDASAGAFKEFLQFFYRRKMQLTMDNVGEVVNLCRKYQVDDALTACEQRIKEKLNIANMCWGHAFSKNFDFPELRNFCEIEIQRNTSEILQSVSFLDSERDEAADILKLLSIDKYSIEMVNAYMSWAKAECVRENLEPDGINLRARLGDDLIKMIPFNRMSMEQFAQHTKAHSGFFTANELEMIIQGVANCSGKHQKKAAALDCDRRIKYSMFCIDPYRDSFGCGFVATKSLLLTEIYASLTRSCSCDIDLVIKFSISKSRTNEGNLIEGETKMAYDRNEIHIVLPEPVLISEGEGYKIVMEIPDYCEPDRDHYLQFSDLQKSVRLNDENNSGSDSINCSVYFDSVGYVNADCVTRLKFNRL